MGDTVLALNPGALELDLLGGSALEQTAPLAEEHRYEMELEPSRTPGASASWAVPAPWTSTFLSPAAPLA